eukprot:TRINITY_DN17812_c0_g1_i1.p1 TRINITY_DN17812_c0_g1~~TRINITY_DN17812_c0_g1_i1.p1  ORF type:complete len:890 (+),score=99.80 TRINITY_DN17812_c0_g1_i1:44-2671(+)
MRLILCLTFCCATVAALPSGASLRVDASNPLSLAPTATSITDWVDLVDTTGNTVVSSYQPTARGEISGRPAVCTDTNNPLMYSATDIRGSDGSFSIFVVSRGDSNQGFGPAPVSFAGTLYYHLDADYSAVVLALEWPGSNLDVPTYMITEPGQITVTSVRHDPAAGLVSLHRSDGFSFTYNVSSRPLVKQYQIFAIGPQFSGCFGEVVVYPFALSTSTTWRVEAELAAKWGIPFAFCQAPSGCFRLRASGTLMYLVVGEDWGLYSASYRQNSLLLRAISDGQSGYTFQSCFNTNASVSQTALSLSVSSSWTMQLISGSIYSFESVSSPGNYLAWNAEGGKIVFGNPGAPNRRWVLENATDCDASFTHSPTETNTLSTSTTPTPSSSLTRSTTATTNTATHSLSVSPSRTRSSTADPTRTDTRSRSSTRSRTLSNTATCTATNSAPGSWTREPSQTQPQPHTLTATVTATAVKDKLLGVSSQAISRKNNVGLIVGLVLGIGLFFIVLIVVCALVLRRHLRKFSVFPQQLTTEVIVPQSAEMHRVDNSVYGEFVRLADCNTFNWGNTFANAKVDIDTVKSALSPTGVALQQSGSAQQSASSTLTSFTTEGTLWNVSGTTLGRGGFGTVYLGMNSHTGQLVAIKELSGMEDGDSKAILREVQLIAPLQHPHIVRYLGSNISGDKLYIVLEYVAGGSLRSLLAKFGTLTPAAAAHFTRHMLMGLSFLHGKSILHRDIKPDNVLVTPEGLAKLTDFGISTTTLHTTAQFTGSVLYSAPELVLDGKLSLSADIWSIGWTTLELLTGHRPWWELGNCPSMAVVMGHMIKHAPQVPEDLPPEAQDFLSSCFSKEPTKRPSADELLKYRFVGIGEPTQETALHP